MTRPEIVDWLHILAASLWGGSVMAFTLVIRPVLSRDPECNKRTIAAITRRLSRLSGIALAGVLLSGAHNAYLQVASFSAFWNTPYGRTLIVKLLLVLTMILLGASSRYLNLPFLQEWAGYPGYRPRFIGLLNMLRLYYPRRQPVNGVRLVRKFMRNVALEALLLVGVLVCVALLHHGMPPHNQAGRDGSIKIVYEAG